MFPTVVPLSVKARNLPRCSSLTPLLSEDEKSATAVVPEQQLSLAIGREGQNVRLAARVSNWKIDIKSHQQLKEMGFAFDEYEDADDTTAEDQTIEETSDDGTDA